MQLKTIVKELCELNHPARIKYITDFLTENKIDYNINSSNNCVNIETIIHGKDPDKAIIFFAHHDIANESTEGANDNASSVAVLLFIARYFFSKEIPYTIKIVFNDKEEYLGALFGNNNSPQINKILNNVGSFRYLQDIPKEEKIIGVFVLELSGIGDSLYFAEKSGNIECDTVINDFLSNLAQENKMKFLKIPISLSDLISVYTFGYRGAVIGAIPYIDGKNYQKIAKEKGMSKEIYPYVWKKNHTSLDKYFSIQEKALKLVFTYITQIVMNINKLKV